MNFTLFRRKKRSLVKPADFVPKNVLIDKEGKALDWSGDGTIITTSQDTIHGETIPILHVREDGSSGWHRAGCYGFALEGAQTHAVLIRPIDRANIYMQSIGAKIIVSFDLQTMRYRDLVGFVPMLALLKDVGDGWYLCAIGFHAKIDNLRIGLCLPGTDLYEQFPGSAGKGFDMAEPMSGPGLNLSA